MPAHPKANRQDNRPDRARVPALAPTTALVAPEPPGHLDDTGREVWTEVWVNGAGAYRATDAPIIERYASLQSRRFRLLSVLDTEGMLTVGSQGQPVPHPAARLLSDIETKLTALEDRLGLNPEARVRLGIATVEHRSKLDDFLGG